MRVRVIRSHFLDGRVAAVGEVLELGDTLARELIATGKLVAEPEPILPPESEQSKPAPKSRAVVHKHEAAS